MLNIQTYKGFPTMHLQTMRHMKREDEVLWSSDNTERHYTYSRKIRLPRYQAKIWTSCCNLLNWQDRCRRCLSYTAPLAFKCGELQPLSLPVQEQAISLSCLWAPSSISSFVFQSCHLKYRWLLPRPAEFCMDMDHMVEHKNAVFCIDQEISVFQTELTTTKTEISRLI